MWLMLFNAKAAISSSLTHHRMITIKKHEKNEGFFEILELDYKCNMLLYPATVTNSIVDELIFQCALILIKKKGWKMMLITKFKEKWKKVSRFEILNS